MKTQLVSHSFIYGVLGVCLGIIVGTMVRYGIAWTQPQNDPPNGTVAGPLTVGGPQSKEGGLTLNKGGTYVNALLIPSGNVGFGTIAPEVELHVKSTDSGLVQGLPNVGNADIGVESVDGFKWTMGVEAGTGDWGINRNIPGDLPAIRVPQNGNVIIDKAVWSDEYCDKGGNNCTSPSGFGGGGGGGVAGNITIREGSFYAKKHPSGIVSCNSDEIVIGGGGNCQSDGSEGGYMIFRSEPSTGSNGWLLSCDTPSQKWGTAKIFAICMKK